MRHFLLLLFFYTQAVCGQTSKDTVINVRIAPAKGKVYFLDCINGFGGGNVAASIGEDGILLVDDMYANMHDKLAKSLATVSGKPVRLVLNTHFHGDHIQGNSMYSSSAIIVAQENVARRLAKKNDPAMMPAVSFTDSLSINFNGETIQLIHFPSSHTDGDAAIYFTTSKVLHLGDMFFFEMFPAVYTEGGGDIRGLIVSLDKILRLFPQDAVVVPGHGRLATMNDLANYVTMLKETTAIVEAGMHNGKTVEELIKEKVLSKYNALGDGGAQTTDQYIAMLYKLLTPKTRH